MPTAVEALKARLADVTHLRRANSVLSWDRQTYMPPGGAESRAEMSGVLARMAHEIFTAPEIGDLLAAAAREVADLPAGSDDACLLRVTQHDYELDTKVPPDFVAERQRHSSIAQAKWVIARAENDYSGFKPYLARSIELARELSDYLGYEGERYDALLDRFEPGMKTAEVRQIFNELKQGLVPLAARIAERVDRVDDSVLHQPFDEGRQEEFGKMVVDRFGYDFNRGRLDRTVHPFAIRFGAGDVRITTRYSPTWLNPALFGTMHESGHAMYEQGVDPSLEPTPLARGASSAVHESQSRLWENVVGRSLPFWRHFFPQLQRFFPEQLSDTMVEQFYAAVNKVQPSLIRVEADEVTYGLHIMLRFELEQDLLDGRVTVDDAAEVWKQKMAEYLGIVPPDDTLGILQDVHWPEGLFGYFPTYLLGTVLASQLWQTATHAIPDIPDQIARGEFSGLHGWLTDNLYRHGRKFLPPELIQRATGRPLEPEPYLQYLQTKFGELYGL